MNIKAIAEQQYDKDDATAAPQIPYSGIKIKSSTTVTINPILGAIDAKTGNFLPNRLYARMFPTLKATTPGRSIISGSIDELNFPA